jgi:hypothetical protein
MPSRLRGQFGMLILFQTNPSISSGKAVVPDAYGVVKYRERLCASNAELFVSLAPPRRDVAAPGKPNITLTQCELDDLPQCGRTTCLAYPAWMEADRHHLRVPRPPFTQKLGYAAATKVYEIGWTSVTLGKDEATVIVDICVGQNQVPLAQHFREERQVIVPCVGVIEKTAFLNNQFTCIDARAKTRKPAHRPLAAKLCEYLNCSANSISLFSPVELPRLFPAPTMATWFMPTVLDCRGDFGIDLKRDGARIKRGHNVVFLEQANDSPDSGSRPVLKDRFRV